MSGVKHTLHIEEGANSHFFDGRIMSDEGRCVAFVDLDAPVSRTLAALTLPKDLGRRLLSALSAAPAPEGGAVWPEVTDAWADTYCALTGRDPDGQQVTFVDGGVATTFRNVAKREIEAMLCAAPKSAVASLATREEAPAEAGEAPEPPAHLSSEAAYGWSCGYEAALRAQPPAREDAQPVDGDWQSIAMWMGFAASVIKSGEPWTDQCQREFDEAKAAYARLSATHPAPDALRVAVEALEKTRDRIQQWPIDDHETCMCGSTIEAHDIGSGHSPVSQADHAISIIVEEINKALAALQAEQKGGA